MGKYYTVENDKYGIRETTNNGTMFIPFGRDFCLSAISYNLDDAEYYLTLEFDYMGQNNSITIPKRDAADVKMLLPYSGKGLDISTDSAKVAVEIIRLKENLYYDNGYSLSYVHRKLGWKDYKDGDDTHRLFFGKYGNKFVASTYHPETFDIEPKGTLEDWTEFVNTNLADDVRIQFVLSVSFAAILRGYLDGKCDCDNFLIGLIGSSSSGKSTMLALMISVFGNPNIGARTLTATWNSTQNALQKRLLFANGYLHGLDELSLAGSRDMTATVYAIATGVEKGALSKERNLNPCDQSAYLVAFTGEHSLFEHTNQNAGLYMRVLEFMLDSWTSSANEAEDIKKFAGENHGTAAPAFADKLTLYVKKYGLGEVLEDYEKCRKLYENKSTREFGKERISSRYGLILLGAYFAKKLLKLKFDVKKIRDFIIECEGSADEETSDRYKACYERIISWAFRNKQHFVRGSNSTATYKEVYGKITAKRVAEAVNGIPTGKEFMEGEIAIIKDCFKKIYVDELGFESPKVITKWMKSNGYLDCEGDRQTRKRMVDGMLQKVYAVKFRVEILQDENKGAILELLRLLDEEEKEEATKHEKEKTKQEEAKAKQEMAKARQEEAKALQNLRSLTELMGLEGDEDDDN